MKYSLLDLVQRILSAMEADEVSTVNETPESSSVAQIIKECYFDIVGHNNLAEHEGVYKLDASTDNTKPCLMFLPETVANMKWLKYNISDDVSKPEFARLRFMHNEDFLYRQSMYEQNDPSVGGMTVEINNEDFHFRFFKDRQPTYYTIFYDKFIIFDGYDAGQSTTLEHERTVAFGLKNVSFSMEDDFVPDLDPRQFQLLLQDAKSTAFVELKQTPNPKAEAKYRKNWILAQKTKDDNDPRSSRQEMYRFGRCR